MLDKGSGSRTVRIMPYGRKASNGTGMVPIRGFGRNLADEVVYVCIELVGVCEGSEVATGKLDRCEL